MVTSAVVETSSDHLGSQKRLPEGGRAAASFFPGKWQQHPIWPCALTAPRPSHCLSRASLLCQGFLLSYTLLGLYSPSTSNVQIRCKY